MTLKLTFASCAIAALAGCNSGSIPVAPSSVPTGMEQGQKFTGPSSDAGVKAVQDTDPKVFTAMVDQKRNSFRTSSDPFALTASEKSFDYSQQAERVFGQIGFSDYAQPEQTVAPPVVVQPQPYRRLSGVVVGDSVLAIIEMGEGKPPELIRPGMRVPHSEEWTVVSIDQDKAVLRRDGNVLPKQIEVRLEVPPAEFAPAQTNPGFPGGPGMGTGKNNVGRPGAGTGAGAGSGAGD